MDKDIEIEKQTDIEKDVESIEEQQESTEETDSYPVEAKPKVKKEKAPKEIEAPKPNSPGIIVLQWITYAFWGWTVFAASLLATNVLAHYLTTTNDDSFAPYAIAAVLVMLPISIICDIFYSKHEPEKKVGGASVIMIIHAVLFALIGIGSLVSIAVSLTQLVITGTDTPGTLVGLYSGTIVATLYVLVFIRTLFPTIKSWFKKVFLIVMIVVIGMIIVFGAIGPVSNVITTRNDTLIDNNLSSIQLAIDNYVNTKDKLPESLSDISLGGDAQLVIDKDLVRFVPDSKPAVETKADGTLSSYTTHYYQLCVTYVKARTTDGRDSFAPESDSDGYVNYLITSEHPAGEYCYQVSSYPTFIKN